MIAKVDADLELAPGAIAGIEAAFAAEPELGLAGLDCTRRARTACCAREHVPSFHVRGATKFYRRACLEQISPVPAILGWDTIDEVHARRLGWTTRSLALDGPPTLHLRPPGAHDGVGRGFRRWGECAWAYGADPVGVLAGGVHRMRRPPVRRRRPQLHRGLGPAPRCAACRAPTRTCARSAARSSGCACAAAVRADGGGA